jgi:hypothetical protein
VIGQAGREVREKIGVEGRVYMHHVLPGHNKLAVKQVVRVASFSYKSSSAVRLYSVYGHPYI